MKNFFWLCIPMKSGLTTALSLPFGIFAQGPNTSINPQQVITYSNQMNNNLSDQLNDDTQLLLNNNSQVQIQQAKQGFVFGTEDNNGKPCDDCAEVKTAIKASKNYSGSTGVYVGRKFGFNAWTKKVSGRTRIKMKKILSHRKKIKTNYDVCFFWK